MGVPAGVGGREPNAWSLGGRLVAGEAGVEPKVVWTPGLDRATCVVCERVGTEEEAEAEGSCLLLGVRLAAVLGTEVTRLEAPPLLDVRRACFEPEAEGETAALSRVVARPDVVRILPGAGELLAALGVVEEGPDGAAPGLLRLALAMLLVCPVER